ncbi:DNA polymerase III subunit alpha [Candidatus Mycoplasma haematominutum]|uniref:DNA polymerase III, alpha subunit n=1 Tax=Candidatus Mycoplasma haematominutum 'Birmingham 1' TaxID=1116213 RepID=G8C2X9_9MOLU|nr:DNA polymerase III subunit alpha [Candidatus Mycoplasma haematominutum]CCE66677.1 DNA polymerase III, alpha subunit [Candidatus Mycoplasma haematominutum 'Birmingham 1']
MANLALPQLFVKSSHSFFESTISIEEIINFHLSNKHKYAILTESQKISHFPLFHYQASKNNLIPVLTLHYVWENSSEWIFIPKNFVGYQSLLKLTANISVKDLEWNSITKVFISGIKEQRPWAGEDFFISNSEKPQGVYLRENLFLGQGEYAKYSLVRALKTQNTLQQELALNSHLQDSYLLQQDPKNKAWKKNLVKLLRECQLYSLNLTQNSKTKSTSREEIVNYCYQKLLKYLSDLNIKQSHQYLERFQIEVNVFSTKQYWDYCFIFYELMQFIQKTRVLTSAGRGSACSSLIIFLLGVTQVDPLKYSLLFDRFLNESSERIPDLDLDIESGRKSEVLRFLAIRFGKNSFVIPSIVKKVKNINVLSPLLEKVLPEKERKDSHLLNQLVGLPYAWHPHPSSLIFLPATVKKEFLSVQEEEGSPFPISPFDYSIISYLGLQKFDLLSSPYLDFISTLLSKIGELRGEDIQIGKIALEDSKTFEIIGESLTYGLFHLDSGAIKKILKQFKPKSIEELAQLISIIRPGINRHIFKFLNYQFDLQDFDTDIYKIVDSTRGIILYQEQIMLIVSTYVNISLPEADQYRIALQNQQKLELKKLKLKFFELAVQQGRENTKTEKLWSFILSFGAYSFNKSHAIAYALSAYQAAYLKANFKELFYAELIKKEGISDDILSELIHLGFKILAPSNLLDWTLLGKFDEKGKTYTIGLNCLRRNSEIIFQKLQKIKRKIQEPLKHDLGSIVFLLLSNGFVREEIMQLNFLNAFKNYFTEHQNPLYLHLNWDYLFNKLIYGEFSIQIASKTGSQSEAKNFQRAKLKNLNINWEKFKLN